MMTSGKIIMEKQTQLINFNSGGIVEMGTILAAITTTELEISFELVGNTAASAVTGWLICSSLR